MWASARFDLGISDADFGRLTMRRFSALMERCEAQEQRAYLRAGVVASTIANAMGGKKDGGHFVPQDFMPGGKRKREVDPEQSAKLLEMMAAQFGGKVE